MADDVELSRKKLEIVMADIERQFGKGSILRIGEQNIEPWPAYSTGALSLDVALGIGGFPIGRIVEIYGPESSGKSTLSLEVIAEAQRQGKTCAFIDAEHALDPLYARDLGVDMDELLICQPDYGEMGLDVAEKLIRSGEVAVVVIDSVAALTPRAELDGTMEQQHMGLQPRMMSKAMRKIPSLAQESNTLVIFTNQIREKIGVMFGNPETTPGGRALRFAASMRIEVRRIEDIKDKEGNLTGIKVKAKIPKNKMAPPLKIAEFDIVYGQGVDNVGCVLDIAVEKGIVTKSGAWYSYNGEQLGQGRPNVVALLKENTTLLAEIKKLVI